MAPSTARRDVPVIRAIECRVFSVPIDPPEADGTLAWSATTVVTVEVRADGVSGLGWTYASSAAKAVVEESFSDLLLGKECSAIAGFHEEMVRRSRNFGRPGVVSCAISAVDIALWDLKARLVGLPLADLFGRCRSTVPIYGSGGFTTYDEATATAQLEHWIGELGVSRVKIKIGESWGTETERDLSRVAHARKVVGKDVELFVDANGGYSRKQAIRIGHRFVDDFSVSWFEEPVSSDDLAGLREVRDQLDCDVAAGEYGFDEPYLARMVQSGAVDCLQIDVTRCGGYTSWLRAAAIAAASGLEVSGHCAPNLHASVAAAVPNLRHVEYFHDHERVDPLLFEGSLVPVDGELALDLDTVGHGMTLKDAPAFRVG
jgi:L-alanine-DL-glutamate epimerase-like enolase superfamily enzyme